MLKLLLTLKSGYCNGVRIRLGPHRRLLNTSWYAESVTNILLITLALKLL
jgi:hypothetical protein